MFQRGLRGVGSAQDFRFRVERQGVRHAEWEIDERDHLQLFRGRLAGAHSPAIHFPGRLSFHLAARVQHSLWPMKAERRWEGARPDSEPR